MPSHLRVLHVSSEPLFFLESLYSNLAFAVPAGDADASVDRIVHICSKLGVSEAVADRVRQGPDGETLAFLVRDFVAQIHD